MKKLNLILLVASSLLLGGCNAIKDPISNNELEEGLKYIEVNKTLKDIFPHSCPSVGKVKALVVPVHFSDCENKWEDTELLKAAFTSSTSYSASNLSVHDFYYASSYSNLDFDFTITDVFTPSNPSSFYGDQTNNSIDSYNVKCSSLIYEEALNYFKDQYDYSNFDLDKDGVIDCIYLMYDHMVDYSYKNMFYWAYTASSQSSVTYNNTKMGKFIWCGYDFLIKDNKECNTQTLIHETGHLFGLDDYYDYATSQGTTKGGLAGADLMDNDNGSPSGDHNSYSKSILGWTKPKIVTTESEITIKIKPLQEEGDLIILPSHYDESKSLYQELFILEYYTPTKLQEIDKPFSSNGIRLLHVNGNLTSKGTFKYDNSYTQEKFISQITTSKGDTYLSSTSKRSDETLFSKGEKLERVIDNNGDRVPYTFKVIDLTNEYAEVKITKI